MSGTYEGAVWSFTTQEFAVVDDIESYNDDEGNRIYEFWIDGYADKSSGSPVGYSSAPFAEKTIVHGGKQSMPLAYDNTAPLSFSEAMLTFDTSQNWTANGIKSLSLFFQGAAGNGGQLYLKINNTKVLLQRQRGRHRQARVAALEHRSVHRRRQPEQGDHADDRHRGRRRQGHPVHRRHPALSQDARSSSRRPIRARPNLLALYAFEGNANDTSGHGLNGTLKQGQLVASGRANGGGSAVRSNKAGYADLGNPPSLDFSTGDWTVTAWYKTAMTGTGDANKGTIYGKGGDTAGGHRYCLIMSETTEGVVTLVTDDDVTKYVVDSKSVTNDDEWHFVVGQREGATLRIYIDGQLEGTGAATATYNLAGTKQHNAYIGAITDHTNNVLYKLYNGLIDDVRIYNQALSEGEILWLAGKTTPVAKPF